MGKNKIVYGGNVLIDLTDDTVAADNLLSGYKAHNKAGDVVNGTCTFNCDSSDATASASDIANGKTAYVKGAKVTGTHTDETFTGDYKVTSNGTLQTAGKKMTSNLEVDVPNSLVTDRERQTPSSNVRSLTFNIDLGGNIPNVIFVTAENLTTLNSTKTLVDACYDESERFILSKYNSSSSALASTGAANIAFDVSTTGKIKITVSNSYFRKGITYYCRAWA